MTEFFDKATKKTPIDEAVYRKIEQTIRGLYQPFETDAQIIREGIVEFARYKGMANIFKEYAGKLQDDPEIYKRVYKEMTRIANLKENDVDESKYRGGAVLADFSLNSGDNVVASPHFLRGLNNITAYGGFYSPQLVLFMGAPKSFKTGMLLKTAAEYVRQGYKVYYVDCENGIKSIRTRFYQAVMEIEAKELKKDDNPRILEDLIDKWKLQGGDMQVGFYPAHTKCTNDVKAELAYLKDELNWEPDLICWDYPDLMLADDLSKRKEKRINIQHTYFDIINLNVELDVFSIALSQVNKNAVNKTIINMRDFSEDFGKAMNCHAAFAICRTQEEVEAGFARIVPVVQREGEMFTGQNQVVIRIEEKKMIIDEIDYDEAVDYLTDAGFGAKKPKAERVTKESVRFKNIGDE